MMRRGVITRSAQDNVLYDTSVVLNIYFDISVYLNCFIMLITGMGNSICCIRLHT